MVQSNHSTALPTLPARMVRARDTGAALAGAALAPCLLRKVADGLLMSSSGKSLFLVKKTV
ncbi:hypothetical protein D3C71_1339670 [compost metagenome]